MLPVMEFALNSARRESEICRLEWADNDPRGRTGMVRDAKHPTKKEGNHRRFKYTPEPWAVIVAQPRRSEFIFPYDPKSVGAAFTRACKGLGIKDRTPPSSYRHASPRLVQAARARHRIVPYEDHP